MLTVLTFTFRELLIEGTKHAVELKAAEKFIERNEQALKQDPSNQTLRSEQTRKLATRDASLKNVKELSARVAQKLENVLGQKTVENSNLTSLKPPAQDAVDLVERLKILEKQMRKHDEESERNHQESQKVIRALERKIASQNNDIRALRQMLESSSSAPPLVQNEDQMAIDSLSDPQDNPPPAPPISASHTPQAHPNLDDQRDLEELRRDFVQLQRNSAQLQQEVTDLAQEITEINSNVVNILTKEIPVNLQRSVRLMQQDVGTAAHTALTHTHNQLSVLIRELVSDWEDRIKVLERAASRYTTVDSITAGSRILRKSSPARQPPATKDPRLLRRQTVVTSSESKTEPSNETKDCMKN